MPQPPAPDAATPRLAVIVSGPSQALLRRFLAQYVKVPFGLNRRQARKRYREHYGLSVVSRVLAPGADAQALYGPHEHSAVLVVGALAPSRPGSELPATRAWLRAKGFAPLAELEIAARLAQNEYIDLGAEVVNFVNVRCPWRNEEIDDIEDYRARHGDSPWG